MHNDSDRACVRCVVYGTVQGVFFRASTRDQARRLSVVGHAKNLPNGSVEIIASGQQSALYKLKDWLHEGPTTAKVTRVVCEPILEQSFSGFQIL